MTTGLYSRPRRTGRKVACAGGGGPTRGHGTVAPGAAAEEAAAALRFRATVSIAALREKELSGDENNDNRRLDTGGDKKLCILDLFYG